MENSIFLKPSLSGYNRWQVSCSAPSQWTGLGTSQPCWTEPATSSRCPPPRTRDWRAGSGLTSQCQRWTSSLQHSRSQPCSLGPTIPSWSIWFSAALHVYMCRWTKENIFMAMHFQKQDVQSKDKFHIFKYSFRAANNFNWLNIWWSEIWRIYLVNGSEHLSNLPPHHVVHGVHLLRSVQLDIDHMIRRFHHSDCFEICIVWRVWWHVSSAWCWYWWWWWS